jgi:hypothetical protein
MSISSVSSTTGYTWSGVGIEWQQEMHDFQALTVAIQSGDLTSILRAFAAWQQDLQTNSPTTTQPTPQIQPFGSNTQANKDFQRLSSALKSGDVSRAQTAFASLQKDVQSAGGAYRYRHNTGNVAGPDNNNSSIVSSNSTTASSVAESPFDKLS